jgi:uncharacterized protein YbaP (TraB family)
MKKMLVKLALRAVIIAAAWFAPLALLGSLTQHLVPDLRGQNLAVAQALFDRGLLWRVERPGVRASYLFGTIHLADPRVTTLPGAVKQQFDAARSFTMEVSLDAGSVATLALRMMFDDGRSLPGVAGEALFERVVPLLEQRGLPQAFARDLKPWAAMLMLTLPPQAPDDVLDVMLSRLAAEQRKQAHFLETVDEQVGAFEDMSMSDQVALLRHAVETQADLPSLNRQLLEAYLQRNLAVMWQVNEAEVAKRPDLKALNDVFAQRLIYDRNTRMAQRMEPQLSQGSAFVAVGALHFYGDKGVLSLLQRNGWQVTRVY